MGRGIFEKLRTSLEKAGKELPDKRRDGHDLKYRLLDAVKCAFAVFFFQHPSLLNFQQEMQRKLKRNNLETLLEVKEIPCTMQITRLLDGLEPERFSGAFTDNLKVAEEHHALEGYRVLDGGVLIALDGVWHFSSKNIHCEHCLHKSKDGITTYYHRIVAATIVKPGDSVVLPVMAEMIRNEDGSEKQDCERNAAKRWLGKYGQEYQWLSPTLLGDDVYSDYPTCKAIVERGMSFIFTCKEASHPWLTETVGNSYLHESRRRVWNGRHHLEYRYRWINGVEIRDHQETLLVNYLDFQIWNEEKGKATYHNSWITNKTITKDKVGLLTECGRARWKIENEHNNVLKNHGYNLEHNFGHGAEHAGEIYCLLDLLSFQFHGILQLIDEGYRKARGSFGRREEFFNGLRFSLRRFLHKSWEDFMLFVIGDED
ncbi:MAG: hypothetical protein LBK62_05600, partial [Treponema sp.]|nr:hypothetical protein [Treponema sp.]